MIINFFNRFHRPSNIYVIYPRIPKIFLRIENRVKNVIYLDAVNAIFYVFKKL